MRMTCIRDQHNEVWWGDVIAYTVGEVSDQVVNGQTPSLQLVI